MFENERKYCFFNDVDAFLDAALYWVYLKNNLDEIKLNFILNSSLIGFFKELLCRPPEGLGAIQMKVYHYNEMPIFAINKLSFENLNINEIFNKFAKREILSVFTELGFDKTRPIREQEPNPLPDRKELDDIVFDALGLTDEERKEVYWAVAELVKARLDKAKSV